MAMVALLMGPAGWSVSLTLIVRPVA